MFQESWYQPLPPSLPPPLPQTMAGKEQDPLQLLVVEKEVEGPE